MKIKSASLISVGILLIYIPDFQKNPPQNLKNDKFFEIKYEELLKQKNTIKLSQVASEVKYIQLETNEKCPVAENAKYYFSGDYIFVRNRDHILQFSSDGKFIRKFGTPGRGPGEIYIIHNVSIIPDKKLIIIYDMAPHKLLYFNFDGVLIKTVNTPRYMEVNVMNDDRSIAIIQESAASEKYTHLLIDKSGDTLSAVESHESWKTSTPNQLGMIGSPSFLPFYRYQNKYYLKSMYNDTVYVVNDNKIRPGYFINLGKYRIPEEKRFERLSPGERQSFKKSRLGYCYTYVFEAGERLFLITNEWSGDYKIDRFVINKRGFIANTENKYSGVYKGYIDNDWDGGALFWPKGSINDNTVFMPIFVADLKNIINFRRSSKSLKTMVKFPDKRNQLEKMAANLDIADNPILMVVTLASEN
jgi:hypothetical protein